MSDVETGLSGMQTEIYKGQAGSDGAPFHGWFTGDLEAWCLQNGVRYEPDRMDLRSTHKLEVKWGVHPRGQQRPAGWAAPTHKTSLSLLVQGHFVLRFRRPGSPAGQVLHHLASPGEYVVWRESVEHTWQAQADSIVLTVRWEA